MLKGSTAVLILDNGEPSFVILGYDSYKNLLSAQEDQDKEIKVNHVSQNATGNIQNGIDPKSNLNQSKFQHRISEKEAELLEKINKEIMSLKTEIDKEEKSTEIK